MPTPYEKRLVEILTEAQEQGDDMEIEIEWKQMQ
jgi:hypothetical protein